MATPHSPTTRTAADQLSRELGEGDLKVISETLQPIAGKYLLFGIQIGVSHSGIKNIKEEYTNPSVCLLEIHSFETGSSSHME